MREWSNKVDLTDGGEIIFKETLDYGYFDGDVYVCSVCGREFDVNDGDYVGTREEYEYFKSKGWKPEHGKPRRLYPVEASK